MPTDNYVGQFGTVKSGAVHDLAVRGSVVGCNYVGGIVANPTNEALLYNLCNYADVKSTSASMLSSDRLFRPADGKHYQRCGKLRICGKF